MTFLTDKIVYPLKISSVEFPPKIKFAKDEPINSIRTVNNQFYTKLETNQWKGDDRYSNILTYTDNQIDLLPGGASYIINQRSNNNNQINLYVFADNKYQGDNFNINYGNWVRKSEIKDLGYDDEGNSYFSPKKDKYYLTHLSSYLQKSQMDEDLVLRKSIDNKKVNAGPETYQLFLYGLLIGIGAIIIWVFTPLGWASIAGILILFFSKNKSVILAGWILSICSLVITLLAGLFLLVLTLSNNSLSDYKLISIIISLLIVSILILIFLILGAKYKK